jgi:predicted methyltransferase
MNSSIDDPINGTQAFKASMRAQWDTAAPGWNAHTTDIRAWLHKPTDAMCRMAGVRAGSRVLDVAAGSGDQTLVVAQEVGAQGYVLATDLSPAIAALARDAPASPMSRPGSPTAKIWASPRPHSMPRCVGSG